MNKKVIAAGMAMVLASMGLTACGDSGSKEAKDSSDETYTVTMAYIGDKEEDTDRIEKKINEIMKKDINMELDIEPISWGAYAETMKLILAKKIGVGIGHFPIYPPAILKESTRI